MKAFLIQYPFGLLFFDEKQKPLDTSLFPKKPAAAAKAFLKLEEGTISDDLAQLLGSLKEKGYDTLIVENSNLAQEIRKNTKLVIDVSGVGELRARAVQTAVETGFSKDAEDFSLWTRSFTMELAKLRVKGAVEQRDLIVAQAIQTLDDLDRTVNQFMGRLREWYGVHFPELDRLIEKHETYARLILDLGKREAFVLDALETADIPKAKAEAAADTAETSMGADISDTDLAPIQTLAKNILKLYDLRQNMENYLDKTMEKVAPNMRFMVGALLGARLIAVAGSLRNLAMRPASTIQVLGAEKALFRSLKTGARPPKHGLIFQAALLHDAKRWQRGKIARALAGKLSIAARADAFGGRFVGDRLKQDLDKRIAEIQEKYKEPPPIKERAERPERRDFRENRGFRERRPDRKERWRQGKWRKGKRAHKG
jgi:nucleolar protein 56